MKKEKQASEGGAVAVCRLVTAQNHRRREGSGSDSVLYRGTQGGRQGDIIALSLDELIDRRGFPRPQWNGPAPDHTPFGRLQVLEGTLPRTRIEEDAEAKSNAAPTKVEMLLSNKVGVVVGELANKSMAELKQILRFEQDHKNRDGVVSECEKLIEELKELE